MILRTIEVHLKSPNILYSMKTKSKLISMAATVISVLVVSMQ